MPISVQALFVIAFAVAPGYVFLWLARNIIHQATKRSDVELVVASIASGLAINGLTFWFGGKEVLERYRNNTLLDRPELLIGWALLTTLAVPLFAGTLVGGIINMFPGFFGRIGLGAQAEIMHAWDFALQLETSAYVRVWLNDGGVVGGLYGTKSFASSDRANRDLYLEEAWVLDQENWFVEAMPNSAGIWISHERISRIEFIAPEPIGGANGN